MKKILPVILGTDINSYGVARSLHEAYGIKSLALGMAPLMYTQDSKIVDVETDPDFNQPKTFIKKMHEVADRLKDRYDHLVLFSCGDEYSRLVSMFKDELEDLYLFNYIDADLQDRLTDKTSFYEVCEEYGLPYPKTMVVTKDTMDTFTAPELFPVILKASDSVEYLHLDFEGKEKAYTIQDEAQLKRVVQKIYEAGYQSELIIQDFIPGDSSKMYVLNAYVNQKGKVQMMCLGRCLLDECFPASIGNYNALTCEGNQDLYATYEKFLQDIGYRGYANFDLKYDERDGQYKVFEINIRQGRSSYYMTTGGNNFTTFYIEDLVENKEGPTHYHGDGGLWLYADPSVVKKYCNPKDRPLVDQLLSQGFRFTQWYEEDRSIKRYLHYIRRRISTVRYYPKYEPSRQAVYEKERQHYKNLSI